MREERAGSPGVGPGTCAARPLVPWGAGRPRAPRRRKSTEPAGSRRPGPRRGPSVGVSAPRSGGACARGHGGEGKRFSTSGPVGDPSWGMVRTQRKIFVFARFVRSRGTGAGGDPLGLLSPGSCVLGGPAGAVGASGEVLAFCSAAP